VREYREKFLRERFEVRWSNLVDKSEERELELPSKEGLWRKILESFQNGFKCEYCGCQMLIKDSEKPYSRSFSLDHRISLDIGGNNALKNFAIICHRCNIVKGTMTEDTFLEILHSDKPLLEKPQLLNRAFGEIWRGRLADKLERLEVNE
jgi:5-methylcytosine-specific restriction endonuclease McrA